VLSPLAQERHGFTVHKLPDYSTLTGTPYEEALQDNTRTAPPAQVAFRCDFPVWLHTLSQRDRQIIDALAIGTGTGEVASKYGVSAARISQMRREFHQAWSLFGGDGCA
jgi:hypothetical protein